MEGVFLRGEVTIIPTREDYYSLWGRSSLRIEYKIFNALQTSQLLRRVSSRQHSRYRMMQTSLIYPIERTLKRIFNLLV